ncbi:VOC family protein [Microtetraspora malaysiensis]|uniref:VOC family protein n=1 Tax=Microtetraspora malaysiensis TaxID=161358 RepID=UPI003D938613
MTAHPHVPAGSNTVNPFIITDEAAELIDFLIDVFGATDVPEARTIDEDGLVLHAELRLGDSLLTLADRKPDWPFTPALTRVYVDDLEATLARAQARGAQIITRPTDFFGDTLARFQDRSGNLWWVYRHDPVAGQDWAAAADADGSAESWAPDADDSAGDWASFSTPELEYIHESLVEAMRSLRDPRTG